MLSRLAGKGPGFTYEVEVVAEHAEDLEPGTSVVFVWKRRAQLQASDAAEVGPDGRATWNCACTQTSTLFKERGGWRPKQSVLKVQAARPEGEPAGGPTLGRAALDLAPYCKAEPYGPQRVTVALQPRGRLTLLLRTRWLPAAEQRPSAAGSGTEISYLSMGGGTVAGGTPQSSPGLGPPGRRTLTTDEQDLEGFDPGGIKAAYPGTAAAAGAAAPAGPSPLKRSVASTAKFGGGGGGGGGKENGNRGDAAEVPGAAAAAGRKPAPAPPGLQVPQPAGEGTRGGGAAGGNTAGTPQLTPVSYRRAVEQLWSSDEEGTPRAPGTVMATVKRWLGGGASARPAAPRGGSATRQLQPTFRTPSETSGAADPASTGAGPPSAAAAGAGVEGLEGASVASLRRRCEALAADREAARAEAYAEASRAVQRGMEVDSLKRAKEGLLARLSIAEEALGAALRDEGTAELVSALAEARVAAAGRDYAVLDLQRRLRQRDAEVAAVRAELEAVRRQYSQPSGAPLGAALAGGRPVTA